MTKFDYDAPAELFTGRSIRGARSMRYHRFDSGAEALRFAVETLPPEHLLAAVLKIDEVRYRHGEIRAFYEASAYPLPRKKAAGETAATPPVKQASARRTDKAPAKSKRAPARKQTLKSKSAA
ncbi:MAG: hypothetical protein IT539_09915 [Bradyrhizobiaceae bacterium]|nr:hypothetical protein [Bradyrhizobiaceae bacterium]